MNDEINTEQPLYLQPQCVDCRFYDGFGACTEHGYQLRDNCEDFVDMNTINKYVDDMEDYKKKYKGALEKLQEALAPMEDGCKISGLTRGCIENIFPELKESEDERIRKAILEHIQLCTESIPDRDKFIAWLEKQGERNFDYEHADIPQKDFAPIEPKFKVGDWLQYRYAEPFLVEEITEQGYCNGDSCLPFEWEDEIHLWTIQDAKDGDVLVDEDNNIGLYLEEKDDLYWHSCIYLGCDGRLRGFSIGGYHNHKNTKPATKEQRDTLIKAMANDGYTFDFEKKELKEIESKTLGPDKVIEWIDEHVPTKFEDMANYVQQFKKDFGL